MLRCRIEALVFGVLMAGVSGSWSAEPITEQALAAKIDGHIAAPWKSSRVQPAAPADDAEFLRRISLDLIGRIPSATEARDFINDKSPDKRRRVVERLLKHPSYVEHFTTTWRHLLLPETDGNGEVQGQLNAFNAWLRKQIAENIAYDRMVRELLTVPFGTERLRGRGKAAREEQPGAPSPLAFYLAKEGKPENLAASTAQLFLGVRLECAQCHDHPTAEWTRQKFWNLAAFFAGLERSRGDQGGAIREVFDRRELLIPGTTRVVEASFLDDSVPQWKFDTTARATLAEWMTAPSNRFFARAAVNRLWAHFFGIGLVEPVDDLLPTNPPSHPELLDDLADQFVAHRFDVQFLIRAITLSKAYHLSSAGSGPGAPDLRLFTRMAVRRLTPEQLYDSLVLATGYRDPPPSRGQPAQAPPQSAARAEFLNKFADATPQRAEALMSIPQALMLMNGSFVADATTLKKGRTLTAVNDDVSLNTAGRVESLFLATLSRKPTREESARLVRYVDKGSHGKERKAALADVFWALLNSPEFILNH
ncbi:MAG TPA: DUF1549 and DUF1553 domain-containing protein [Gemmataceae bacterium]|nr:DUF1549 and DUF1553 domain-containing protein [Gemmataceae bacterium]